MQQTSRTDHVSGELAEMEHPTGLREAILEARGEQSAEDLFSELGQLARIAVDVTARIQEFINSKPVIGVAKVDRLSTTDLGAGEYSFILEPTESLRSEVAAVRALYAKGHAIGSR